MSVKVVQNGDEDSILWAQIFIDNADEALQKLNGETESEKGNFRSITEKTAHQENS